MPSPSAAESAPSRWRAGAPRSPLDEARRRDALLLVDNYRIRHHD
ncbi:hypothetical protein [Streptomyces lasiicapitis]